MAKIRTPLEANTTKQLLKAILPRGYRNKKFLNELTREFTQCCSGSIQTLIYQTFCESLSGQSIALSFYAPGVGTNIPLAVEVNDGSGWVNVFSTSSWVVDNGLGLVIADIDAYVGTEIEVRVLLNGETTTSKSVTLTPSGCA